MNIHKPCTCATLTIIGLLALASPIWASALTWSAAISSATTLPVAPSAGETLLLAVNAGGAQVNDVNGMTFAAGGAGTLPNFPDAFEGAGNPPGLTAAFTTVLNSHNYDSSSPTNVSTNNLVFTGLTVGGTYRIQLGMSDVRGDGVSTRQMRFDGEDGDNSAVFTRGANVHFTAEFTAEATTETIGIIAQNGPAISWYTLTELSLPSTTVITWSGPIDSATVLPVAPGAGETLLTAVNAGGPEVTGVNGMTFVAGPAGSQAGLPGGFGGPSGPPPGASAEFATVLDSHNFSTGGANSTGELLLAGLTVGRSYRLQLGMSDTRVDGGISGRRQTFSGAQGNVTPVFARGDNVHFTGTFVATATNEPITVTALDQDATVSWYTLVELPTVVTTAPDSVTMQRVGKVRIPVLTNDTGSADVSSLAVVTGPASGTAVPQTDGTILYTYTGTAAPSTDTFTYTVDSTAGTTSAPETVTVNFTSDLRLVNTSVDVPLTPPVSSSSFQMTNAFPGLTAFSNPTAIASPPGETGRLFVCEKGGDIELITGLGGSPTRTQFLNLDSIVNARSGESFQTTREAGLVGLAFHPNFASNRYFYVVYHAGVNGSSLDRCRLSRFEASSSNPNVADPNSESIIFEQQMDTGNGAPYALNHLAGDIHFGPDGYLYMSLGDEGFQHDYYDNGQHLDKDLWTGILRIDVDRKAANLEPNDPGPQSTLIIPKDGGVARYKIPVDNPFIVGGSSARFDDAGGVPQFNGESVQAGGDIEPSEIRTELYAVGARNPWRFHVDPVTGDIWYGDTSQDTWEEINKVTLGDNSGWGFYEGGGYNSDGDFDSPAETEHESGAQQISGAGGNYPGIYGLNVDPAVGFRPAPSTFTNLKPPAWSYRHTGGGGASPAELRGNAVIGGIVYRGSSQTALFGKYLFSDYISSNVWTLVENPGAAPTVERIAIQSGIVAWGLDPSTEDPLAVNHNTGQIMRLTATTSSSGNFPQTLSETGIFADLTDLTPAPGVVAYDPNLRFWSDHAKKTRWFVINNTSDTMTYSRDGAWTFPTGLIWVKHFDMALEREEGADGIMGPKAGAVMKRLETRLLVKTASGSYGVSYRWNEAGTEATLAPDTGEQFDINLTEIDQMGTSTPVVQKWQIPSAAQCSQCHVAGSGHGLSFNTRQLNTAGSIGEQTGNFLKLLEMAGYLDANLPEDPQVLPKHVRPDETQYSLEARARSYLDVNCSYCHHPSGGFPSTSWDGRHHLSLTGTSMLNGDSVVPGNPDSSRIRNRAGMLNGATRMPPLGSNIIDDEGVKLLTDWINSISGYQSYQEWRIAQFGNDSSPEGEPTANPDGDAANNEDEYGAATNPNDSNSVWNPLVSLDSSALTYTQLANRFILIETSTDLTNWTPLNVPENDGTRPAVGGNVTIPTPLVPAGNGQRHFFRFTLQDR